MPAGAYANFLGGAQKPEHLCIKCRMHRIVQPRVLAVPACNSDARCLPVMAAAGLPGKRIGTLSSDAVVPGQARIRSVVGASVLPNDRARAVPDPRPPPA